MCGEGDSNEQEALSLTADEDSGPVPDDSDVQALLQGKCPKVTTEEVSDHFLSILSSKGGDGAFGRVGGEDVGLF